MGYKFQGAFALACIAAFLAACSKAQGRQDCEAGPPPPRDLQAFVWVNSGFERQFGRKSEAAAKERLRVDFLCQATLEDLLFTELSAVVPILGTDFSAACSIPIKDSCNLLSSCPAGDPIIGRRRLAACMPVFGCSVSVAAAVLGRERRADGVPVQPPEGRQPMDPKTTVGICFGGSCSVLGVNYRTYLFAALAYRLCPGNFVNTIVGGWTPLHWAANMGESDRLALDLEGSVRALVKNGADLEARDAQGFTPLHLASELGLERSVRAFIEAGANIEAIDNMGNTPLAVASFFGRGFVVDLLLKEGANPNRRYLQAFGSPGSVLVSGNFKTPLHFAALYGLSVEIVTALLEAGARVHAVDSGGNTALQIARRLERDDVVRVLTNARPHFRHPGGPFG